MVSSKLKESGPRAKGEKKMTTRKSKKTDDGTKPSNFDIRIPKALAEYLLKNGLLDNKCSIMCKEYGADNREPGDDDWIGITADDLDDDGKLDDDWKTFELWTMK